MPDIDTLMQEWPPEFEEMLKEVTFLKSGIQNHVVLQLASQTCNQTIVSQARVQTLS